MRIVLSSLVVAVSLAVSPLAEASEQAAAKQASPAEKCEHGVAEGRLHPLQPEARGRLQGEG